MRGLLHTFRKICIDKSVHKYPAEWGRGPTRIIFIILTKSVFGLGLTRAFPVQQPVPGHPLQIRARKAQVEFAAATQV